MSVWKYLKLTAELINQIRSKDGDGRGRSVTPSALEFADKVAREYKMIIVLGFDESATIMDAWVLTELRVCEHDWLQLVLKQEQEGIQYSRKCIYLESKHFLKWVWQIWNVIFSFH